MTSPLSRAVRFVRAEVADVRSCPRIEDKIALTVGRGGRVLTSMLNALAGMP